MAPANSSRKRTSGQAGFSNSTSKKTKSGTSQWKYSKGKKAASTQNPLIDKLVSILTPRLKEPFWMKRDPKDITLIGNTSINISRNDPNPLHYLPITWGIPRFRESGVGPDSRYTDSNQIWLTGVKIRFLVQYQHAYRLRMAVYQPQTTGGVFAFQENTPTGFTSTSPVVGYRMNEQPAHDRHIMPGGPFAIYPEDKQRTTGPVLRFDATDGTPFTASLAKGPLKPKGQYKRTGSNPPSSNTQEWEVKWWVPIGELIEYQSELDRQALNGQYQIVLFCDIPFFQSNATTPVSTDTVVRISPPHIKVYYR